MDQEARGDAQTPPDSENSTDKETPTREHRAKSKSSDTASGAGSSSGNGRDRTRSEEWVYSRSGFYCAIGSNGSESEALQPLLEGLSSTLDDRMTKTKELQAEKVKYVEEQIREIETKLHDTMKTSDNRNGRLGVLYKDRDKLLSDLTQLKKRINDTYAKLAEAKKKMVDGRLSERLREVESELLKILENATALTKKLHESNQQIFDGNSRLLQERLGRLNDERSAAEQSLARVREKLQALRAAGMSAVSTLALNAIGWIGVMASAWFYSVYVVGKDGLENADYFSFILTRIIGFGDHQFSVGSPVMTLAIFIFVWLLLLSVVSLVVWGCARLIGRRTEAPELNAHLVVSPLGEGAVGYYSLSTARDAWTAWLDIVPYVFVTGVILTLISFFGAPSGSATTNISTPVPGNDLAILLKSLAGEFVGAVIALILTGLVILYLSFVVEPRLLKRQDNVSSFRKHWEIVLVLALFVITIGATLLFARLTAQEVAAASYALMAMATAIVLSHGIKYRGMANDERRLERKIEKLDRAIEDNLAPKPLDISRVIETSHRDLLDAIQFRNAEVRELMGDQHRAKRTNLNQENDRPVAVAGFRNWLLFIFGKKQDVAKPKLDLPEVTPLEEKYFPEYRRIISEVQNEWQDKQRDYELLTKKIDDLLSKQNDDSSSSAKKIEELRSRLRERQKELMQVKHNTIELLDHMIVSHRRAEIAVRDGFNLGMFYCANRLGEGGNGRSAHDYREEADA
jgi:hypothetical protein